MPSPRDDAPWLLVCGGFHRRGAMDRANLALAEHLASEGREVHLVGHEIDPTIACRPGVHAYPVLRLGAVVAGELMLARAARRVDTMLRWRNDTCVHVIANGGNFATTDANWAHTVHHGWTRERTSAPFAHRAKRSVEERVFRRREGRAFTRARLVIANSIRTRQDLLDHFRLDPSRIRVIPPGVDQSWRPPSTDERSEARRRLAVKGAVALFVGALGADDNKGFGPLLEAWRVLCREPSWDGTLLVAGEGALSTHWARAVRRAGLDNRVRFLGFVPDPASTFAAADLFVSASRYESYGLAIAEALCRGIPAIVPSASGIAASLGTEYEGLLVDGMPGPEALIAGFRRWAADRSRWDSLAAGEGARLRHYTLDDMAGAIVRAVNV